jgi:anthranilate phosphoribosyltransferase
MSGFKPYLQALRMGMILKEQEMADAMRMIMEGAVPEDDLAAFLTVLADRGEMPQEITGAARILREKSLTIHAPDGAVDCCGTGGDGIGTYNISTAVALVAAACGVPVAKHGNRSASSKSGAADVLEALGINLNLPLPRLEEALNTFNFAFLMAPNHHEAMRHVMPVRRKLGFRTIFNLLGPLANPANAKIQLVGVYDRKWLRPMAEALRNLGTESGWTVHGQDGLDEISISGITDIADIHGADISVAPEDFGLNISPLETLKGGDAKVNAAALHDVLNGVKTPYRDIVIANAAGVLKLAGRGDDLKKTARLAAEKIDDGSALSVLSRYKDFTQQVTRS